MISILIPIFNFDARLLVADLHRQCEAAGQPFEIICFDDGSTPYYKEQNRALAGANVKYLEMHQNLGRSAIRNALGKAAKFDYLLFMDCDSKVVKGDYIKSYLDHISPNSLLYGGRCYAPQIPDNQKFILHWKYGMEREQSTVEERQRQPWHSFMTNNFLLPKAVFWDNGFDESLKQYGHEDTLFGLQLAAKNIRIIHFDNPLEHIGLETAEIFLRKTEQGLENLLLLWQRGTPIDTKLLRYFSKIKKWRMADLVAAIFKLTKPILIKNLTSENPNLTLFDFHKLGYLCLIGRRSHPIKIFH